ncbi:MAG: discoidin domain-containing protein [Magnetococcus sp. YQC-9]
MSAHRFWRLYFTDTEHSQWLQIYNLEFRATIGGPSICTEGLAFAASSLQFSSPSAAFDGDDTTSVIFRARHYTEPRIDDEHPIMLGYDLGEGRASAVEEIAILAPEIHSHPRTFSLQHSDDGIHWTILKLWTKLSWRYFYDKLAVFSLDWSLPATAGVSTAFGYNHTDPGPHRYWRLFIIRSNFGGWSDSNWCNGEANYPAASRIEFRAICDGPSICVGGAGFSGPASGSWFTNNFDRAFDDNPKSNWFWADSNDCQNPVWIGYDLGFGRASVVEEIAYVPSFVDFDHTPNTFSLQYSDDGQLWHVLKNWHNLGIEEWKRYRPKILATGPIQYARAGLETIYPIGGEAISTHRFWRLFITRSNFGGWSNSDWCTGEANHPIASRIEFRAECDGPSICVGGAAFSGPASDGPDTNHFDRAFDDDPESNWGWIDDNDCQNPVWIGYDLGDGHTSVVEEIAYAPSLDIANTPNTFSLQYSDDGQLWRILKNWHNLEIEEWTPYHPTILATGPIQYARAAMETSYTVGGELTSVHRFWRLHVTASTSTRPYVKDLHLIGLQMRAVIDGTPINVNNLVDASHNPADAEWLFWGQWDWVATSYYGGDLWVSYDLGEGVVSDVVELLIKPLRPDRAPADFTLQHSDDGLIWTIRKRWSGLTSRDWEDWSEKLLILEDQRTSGVALKTAYHLARTGATAHRFWRLFMTAAAYGTGDISLTKVEFRSVAGGPSICVAGTAIDSHGDGEVARNPFDEVIGDGFYHENEDDSELDWFGQIGGYIGGWSGWDDESRPIWVGYDLGEGRAFAVAELVIVVRGPADAPAAFSLQYSDDGEEWWTIKSWEVDPDTEWPEPEDAPEDLLIAKSFTVEPLVFFLPVIGASLATRYGVFTGSALVQPQYFGAGRALATPFAFMRVAATALATPYGSAVVAINGLITPSAILDFNPAGVGLVTIYRIIDSDRPTVVPPLDPHLIHGTRRIEVASAEIGMAEGDYGWSGSAAIAALADFQALGVDDPVTLMLGETGFSLLVDSRSVSRGANSVGLTVSLVSATATLSAPRSALISMTPDAIMTAREAAESAVGAIEWSMLDWPIPPGRIAFHEAAPMAIAEAIAAAAGGVIETLPDGRMRARHRFPVRVPDWPNVLPDHILTEESILYIQESYRHLTRVDRVVVRDWQPNDSGRLAIEPDSRPMGLNRGSPNLYPGALVHLLVHASPDVSNVTLTASAGKLWPGELQQWQETIDLVFADKATVTLPAQVISLDAYHWLGNDLGALTLDADCITVTAIHSGLSVARVQVTRRALSWLFQAPRLLAGETQFPIIFVATATDGDSRAAGEITALRGEGLHPGDDILEPLASHVDARRERGRAVIDAGEPLQEVTVATLFNADFLPGQLIEVNDAAMGVPWRGKAKSVRHSVGDFPTTTLDLVRYVTAR